MKHIIGSSEWDNSPEGIEYYTKATKNLKRYVAFTEKLIEANNENGEYVPELIALKTRQKELLEELIIFLDSRKLNN